MKVMSKNGLAYYCFTDVDFCSKKTYTCVLQKTSISTSIHGKMSQIFKKYAKIGYIDIIY